MTKIVLILFLLGFYNIGRTQQNTNDMIERFDFSLVKGETDNVYLEESNGWTKLLSPQGDYQAEYAPAKDFYEVTKKFHDNGIIKSRGKQLGRVKFGIWEYFDETSKLTELMDEDKKFGKIKPADAVDIIEQQGIINRKEGTSILFPNQKLGTTGDFYLRIISPLMIDFKPAETDESGKEITPCYWKVSYEDHSYVHHGQIEGNTGEWTEFLQGIIRIR